MSTHEEQAREVYGKLYIDEHGDVTTKERDIAIIAAALDQAAQEAVKSFEQREQDMRHIEHRADILWTDREELKAQLQAALPVWTTDKPTVAGWYWWRRLPDYCHGIPLHIRERDGVLYLEREGFLSPQTPNSLNGEWARCPLPKEAT